MEPRELTLRLHCVKQRQKKNTHHHTSHFRLFRKFRLFRRFAEEEIRPEDHTQYQAAKRRDTI